MQRREFITLLGGAAVTWPLAARAQQGGRGRRVAFWLGGAASSDSESQRNAAALRDALRTLGWIEGRNRAESEYHFFADWLPAQHTTQPRSPDLFSGLMPKGPISGLAETAMRTARDAASRWRQRVGSGA